PFLEEVRKSGVAQVSAWADEPEPDAENPLLAAVEAADWPATPAGQRFAAVREAAALVEAALGRPAAAPQPEDLGPRDLELTEAWDRDAGLLLAERAQRRGDGATQVPLPARLSVSSLVAPARDPAEGPFGTLIGGRLVRGRIDAVFADDPGGGYDVVDWKTGRPPGSEAERHAVSVQLAAYRLAWAALAGLPVADVRAAFYYVAHDQTVRPADLLDEAGLAALIEQVPAEA